MERITMTMGELRNFIARSSALGYMEAVKAYEPAADLVRETEICQWLRVMHIEQKKFKALVKNGTITVRRKGVARNSPAYYSKQEVVQALATAELSLIVRNNSFFNASL